MSDTSNTNAENNSAQTGATMPLENPVNGVVTNAPIAPTPATTTTTVSNTTPLPSTTTATNTTVEASVVPQAQTVAQVSNTLTPTAATSTVTEQSPIAQTPAPSVTTPPSTPQVSTPSTEQTVSTESKEVSNVASTQPTGSSLGIKPIKTVGESSVSFNTSSEQSTNTPSELSDEMKVEAVKEAEKKDLEKNDNIEKTEENKKGKFPFMLFGLLGFFIVAFIVYYFILITPYRVFNHMIDSRINNLKSQISDIEDSDLENLEIDVDTTLNTFDLNTSDKSPIVKQLTGRNDYPVNELKYTASLDLDIKKQNLAFDLVAYYNEEDKKKGKDKAFIDEALYLVDNSINVGTNNTPIKINYNSGSDNNIDFSFNRINEAIDALIIIKDEALKQVKKEILKRKLVKTSVAGQTALAIKIYCNGDKEDLVEIEKGILSSILNNNESINKFASVFGITPDEMKHYIDYYIKQGPINSGFNIEILSNLAATEIIGVKVKLDNIYVNINHLNGIYDIDITTYSNENDENGNRIKNFHTDLVFDTYHGVLNGKISINNENTRLSFLFNYEKSKNGGDSGNLVNIYFYRNAGENLDADIFDEEMEKYGEVRTAKSFADFKWVLSRKQNTKLNVIDKMQKITAPYDIIKKYTKSDSNYNEKRSVCLSMFDSDGNVIGIKDKDGNTIKLDAKVTEDEYNDAVCFFANPEIIALMNNNIIEAIKKNPNILKDTSKLKSLNLTKNQMIFINEMTKTKEKSEFLMELINNSDSEELKKYLEHPETIITGLDMIDITFEDIIFVVYNLFATKQFNLESLNTYEKFYNFMDIQLGSDPMEMLGDLSLKRLLNKICKDGKCEDNPNKNKQEQEEAKETIKNEISINSQNNATTLDKKDKQLQLTLKQTSVNDNEKFTWSSSDEKIAKVDNNGLVTYVSSGTVLIKVQGNIDSGETTFELTLTDNNSQNSSEKKEEPKKQEQKQEEKKQEVSQAHQDEIKAATTNAVVPIIGQYDDCEDYLELAGETAYNKAKELGYNETTCNLAREEARTEAMGNSFLKKYCQ